MGKQGKDHNSRIWRTVVFAGAMLGAPTIAAAGDPAPASKPPAKPAAPAQQPAPTPPPPPAKPVTNAGAGETGLGVGGYGTIGGSGHSDPVKNKQMAVDRADSERKALLTKLSTVDVSEVDKVKREIAAKDAQIKKLVDELVTLRKPRPRVLPSKPMGRGFVLA